MFKRILLSLTFVAAFGAAGFCLTDSAQAWRGGYYGRPYYGPRVAYYGAPVVPYRAYYGPRVVRPYPVYYAPPAYPVYYGGYGYPASYYAPGGVRVSVGF